MITSTSLSLSISPNARSLSNAEMNEVSTIVKDVEKNMEQNLAHISEDLKELADAELQKERLDAEIIDSKERSLTRIKTLEKHIQKSEQNFDKSFLKIKKDFQADVIILEKNQSFVEKMHKQEELLQKKLEECDTLSKKIHADFAKQTKTVKDAAEHMNKLQKERAGLLNEVEKEHTQLKEILAKSKKFEASVSILQKKVYTNITDKIKNLEKKQKGAKDLPKNIQTLLEKKNRLKNIISDLTHAQASAKNEVNRLKKESDLLKRHIGIKDVDKELEKIYADIEAMKTQKSFLTERLKELYSVISLKK